MNKVLFLSLVAGLAVSSNALASYEDEFDPAYEAISSVEDDFMRPTFKKVGNFWVDRCYAAEEHAIEASGLAKDPRSIKFCNTKSTGKLLNQTFAKPANFNKNYVLHQHTYPNAKKTETVWFAIHKSSKKVSVLPVIGRSASSANPPKLSYGKNSNRLCINTASGLKLWDSEFGVDVMSKEYDIKNHICYWLKEDKKGPYWTEWP